MRLIDLIECPLRAAATLSIRNGARSAPPLWLPHHRIDSVPGVTTYEHRTSSPRGHRSRGGWLRRPRSPGSGTAITASLTVCQSQPRSEATSVTVRPCSPTWRVTHLPARSVNDKRGGAIRGFCSVHDPTGHAGAVHPHRYLRHPSRARRPNTGRSTNSTRGRSLTTAAVPHRTRPTSFDIHPQRLINHSVDAEHGDLAD